MKQPWWRRKRVWGLVVAFAFLVFSFWGIDSTAVWAAFRNMRPMFLLPVLAGVVVMPLLRSLRLKYILDLEHKVTQRRLFAIYNVGQLLNQILPALTGQVARVVLFSRTLGVTKTFAFSMVVLEVLFDGITLIMLIFGASFLIVLPDWMVRGEFVILLACLLLLGAFYLLLHRARSNQPRDHWWRHRLPRRLVAEWDSVSESFISGLTMLRSARHLLVVSLLSVLSWLIHALLMLFLLWSFGFHFQLWVAIVILIVNTLAIMIPFTPGNIGTFQLACILGLGFFGVSKDRALGFSILLHLVEVLPVFLLGSLSSFSEHVKVKDFRTSEMMAETDRLTQGVLDLESKAPCPADATNPTDPRVSES